MSRRGHVPLRMCSGCGERFAKAGLVRFTVRDTVGSRMLVLDTGADGSGRAGVSSGRGGYVCPDIKCLESALGRKTLVRRLRATTEAPALREEFERLIEARKR